MHKYTNINNNKIPVISGAKGKGSAKIDENSLFSTDVLFVTTALGEGPLYRINPNGPQDIQIQDNTIDDLVNLDGDGLSNEEKFKYISASGTTTQAAIDVFGETIITPQTFSSSVTLRYGNIDGIPSSKVLLQETSARAWDAIKFNFIIGALFIATDEGDSLVHSLTIRITIYDSLGIEIITTKEKTITGKTESAFRFSKTIRIKKADRSDNGYRFTIEKISDESDDSKIRDDVSFIGWDEIENSKQAYPRTAIIGYALKAVDEHVGTTPNFTSVVKGLITKVPSNYNQPRLKDGQIDWREVEVATSGVNSYTTNGYRLQNSEGTVLYNANPQIYVGTWDGSFVYSWTQNPVWIVYDLLTNNTYGLGISEEYIDKYRFYQIAQYCDACDSSTGMFYGVSGLADGTNRNKPLGLFWSNRENQIGLPKGTDIIERRFIMDISITDQEQSMDIINKICATFRAVPVYSGGKLSLAVDMPEEYPVMLFNETNMKSGSFQISGIKESSIYTGIDISYIEPSNHFKRENIRIDTADANDGTDKSVIENIASLDLMGVTRRSQAIRTAQYQIAASKYLRRSVNFTASSDAINLSVGDVISVSTRSSGIGYGYGGRILANSAIGTSVTNVHLEHFTVPSLSAEVFTDNTYPIAMRIIRQDTDRMDLYLLSDTTYNLYSTGNTTSGYDYAVVKVDSIYDRITRSVKPLISFDSNNSPRVGDLWSIGEVENVGDYYTNKAGKLFKVTNLSRDPKTETIEISAIEYISNVYIDSDTFINYEPTAYTDIKSSLSVPPAPHIDFFIVPREAADGSVRMDGLIEDSTDKSEYGLSYETEYYVGHPEAKELIANVITTNPMTIIVNNNNSLIETSTYVAITGKNGFTSELGTVSLYCNAVTQLDGNLVFTVEGLSSCFDNNFYTNILEANTVLLSKFSGANSIKLPVKDKLTGRKQFKFVGYRKDLTSINRNILAHDLSNNTITVEDTSTNGVSLHTVIGKDTPFLVDIYQTLNPDYSSNAKFFVKGTEKVHTVYGNLTPLLTTTTINLPIKVKNKNFINLYIDGRKKSEGQYILNKNENSQAESNIKYTNFAFETEYRVEIEDYTVPTIEIGDNVQIGSHRIYSVINSSYDSTAASYNAALTENSIYQIELARAPTNKMKNTLVVNVSPNPIGILGNVSSNSATFDYSSNNYYGSFNLANNRIYDIEVSSVPERFFLATDRKIPDLPYGVTSLLARNKNTMGRTSPYVHKSVIVYPIPMEKVQDLEITESLYREQVSGVAVRVTCSFTHTLYQSITDYEISYKLDNVDDIGIDDGGTSLTTYNTVKISAKGVDDNGKINFTVSHINRGTFSESNSITFRVTPLNRNIRGMSKTITKTIIGKTAPPKNIYNFTGGQQNEQITLFWKYYRINDELEDLDLKEIVIRRIKGKVSANISNFLIAEPFVIIAAGSVRKSIPIDFYGKYTYLARTRDTSGNFSESVTSVTIATTKPERSIVVGAYSEDDPSTQFTNIPNDNILESNFPSYANSITGGLCYPGGTSVDNANGVAVGFSVVGGLPTDLLATESATYITQIRDYGSNVIASITLDIEASQVIQTLYTDAHSEYLESVSESSADNSILVDSSFGGIGHLLGYSNTSVVSPRYDANNKTWMVGTSSGSVYGIWNHGQYVGDTANSNSYALIAGLINANAIALGMSYYANGVATGSNNLTNVTSIPSTYTIVDFTQYNDSGSLTTYEGDLGAISTQTYIRTSSADSVYYANGNVDYTTFDNSDIDEGFIPYEAGVKTFRFFQIKFVINNSNPDEFDFTIDKLRYTINKEQTIYTTTVPYSASPTTISLIDSKYLSRPVVSYSVLDQKDPLTNMTMAVTTAASNNSVSFKLFAVDGTGEYTANSTANVMITTIGV